MNHQPFETWLLDDKHLTAAEKRDLNSHLRECRNCSALAETGLVLRSTRTAAPAPGFVLRFQNRLAAQKTAERRRLFWGMTLFVTIGLGLFGWLAAPYIMAFAAAPLQWLFTAGSYVLYTVTSLHAFSEMLLILARVLPNFVPPYAWMVFLSFVAGVGLLWMVSIWRFVRKPMRVTA